MKNGQHRVTLTLGAVAGGLLAATLLPIGVAFADEYDFTPDPTTFELTQVEGYPPLDNEATGTDYWNFYDVTSGTIPNEEGDQFQGIDTVTTLGSFTNDDFLSSADTNLTIGGLTTVDLAGVAQIDLANFGGGFENEWIDVPSGSTDPGVSDLLITPFGDFALAGSFFTDLSTVLSGITP
jgi:hypothetical protein